MKTKKIMLEDLIIGGQLLPILDQKLIHFSKYLSKIEQLKFKIDQMKIKNPFSSEIPILEDALKCLEQQLSNSELADANHF